MSDESKLSRREFIKDAAIGAAAVVGAGVLATPAQAQAQAPWLPAKWDYETDVVVVGFGGAGASAAIRAFDDGAKVLILEKMPKGLEGGNTCVSGGGATHTYDKAKSVDHIYALCMGDTDNPTTSKPLVTEFVDTMAELLDYYKALGIRAEKNVHDYSHFFVSEAPNIAGAGSLHQSGLDSYKPYWDDRKELGSSGTALFQAQFDNVTKRGIQVLYDSPARELVQDAVTKEILGVKAVQAGKEVFVKAKRGVVLALGGFENSPEMQSWFYNPGIRAYPGGTPGNTGDGNHMVERVGGVVWHMQGVEVTGVGIRIPSQFLAAPWPKGVDATIGVNVSAANSYIIVNKYGKRFTNNISYKLGHTHRNDLTGFTDYSYFDGQSDDPTSKSEYTNSPFYLVFDEAYNKSTPMFTGETFGFGTRWNAAKKTEIYTPSKDNSKEIANGIITKADTIADLAAKMKIDAKGLQETITKYNEYCAAGKDPDLGVPKAGLIPVKTPPYYAVRLHVRLLNTQGGAKRNGKAEIVDMYDKPIPRLYGAGEFGSIYGALYHGSGNNAEAATVGFRAGRNAAALKPWDKAV